MNTSFAVYKTPMMTRCLLSMAVATSLATASITHASEYSSVTFFGDSLTDGGYFSPITQGALGQPQSGQFTTNPDNVWATSFAEQLGTTAVANKIGSPQTGNNYAIGGARAGVDVTRNFGTIQSPNNVPIASANSQANSYLANNSVDANGLYVLWAGANDLLAINENPANALGIINSAVQSQIATVTSLKNAGANYILVLNIPDVGLTPDAISGGLAAQAQSTAITNLYNQSMLKGVVSTGANIIPLDTFSLTRQVAANPAAYGFTNTTDRACEAGSSLTCGRDDLVTPNANEDYFFADGIHPTGRAHQLIADYANAVVTAPSQIGLLPHIATTAGLATTQRLQSHINQIQNNNLNPARNLWAIGEFENQDIAGYESDGNAQVLLGMDFAHPNSTSAVSGIYANITQKEFDNDNVKSGLSNIDLGEFGMGIYHTTTLNRLANIRLDAAAGFGNLDVEVTRAVSLGDYKQEFKSDADGKRFYANLQAGYPIQVSSTDIVPYLSASINRVKIDGLDEQENSGVAMSFDEQKYTTTYGKIGVKANHLLANNLSLFGDLHYQKQLDDNRKAASARLNTIRNISFDTPTIETDDDNFEVTLGLTRNFGLLNANAGVTHSQGDDDDSTSLFVGLSGAF